MYNGNILNIIKNFWDKKPYAEAKLHGSALASELEGITQFYPMKNGTLVVVEVSGLPEDSPAIINKPAIGPFGFHIHEGGSCGIDGGKDAFLTAGAHYNPTNTYHPEHAGDLPVLFSNHGYSFMAVYTDRFTPKDVVDRTVMIHQSPDDFRSQPSGDSGTRIACGVIKKL